MDLFKERFSENNIKESYLAQDFSSAPGIDRVNKRIFEKKLTQHIQTIHRKVLNETYVFTSYREFLIIKNRDNPPRMISIPTIRDKLVLRILSTIIRDAYSEECNYKIVQTVVNEIKQYISQYDYLIKLDIKDYYPSINHKILFTKIKEKIRSRKVLGLIRGAIRTPTVLEKCNCREYKQSKRGIPQGLPISNILSSIYLLNLDIKYSNLPNLRYFRFVDDILILCNKNDSNQIQKDIFDELKKNYKLTLNEKKVQLQSIDEGFAYLGYFFKGSSISVREQSKRKLENSLENLFIDYKNSGFKRTSFFLWKLNMKITGCMNDNKKYGWVFFFSQITEESILYHFDWFVQKLIKRFDLEKKLNGKKIKRFVKTYHEILSNLSETGYIPRFDKYSLDDKERFLKSIEVDLTEWSEDCIVRAFKRITFSSIRDLERDIQSLRERY